MTIVVYHEINNPAEFWTTAQNALPELPTAGVQKIIQVLPNNDMTQGTCVWEADSIEALDAYLRSKVHDWSKDSYYELNTANSMGLTV